MAHPQPIRRSSMPIRHKILLGFFFTVSGLAVLMMLVSLAASAPVEAPASGPSSMLTAESFSHSPTATPTSAPNTATPASAAETGPEPEPTLWIVTRVIDGDTIEVARDGTSEKVRLVGVDTPEQGECGYEEATSHLLDLIRGSDVKLVEAGTDDRDKYDRLLRYVETVGVDVGFAQIEAGMAITRYDSRDGYGPHDRETEYFAADEGTSEGYTCEAVVPEPEPGSVEPWNQPGPDLDCADIGKKVRIASRDYHRLDADGDGWGCESYG